MKCKLTWNKTKDVLAVEVEVPYVGTGNRVKKQTFVTAHVLNELKEKGIDTDNLKTLKSKTLYNFAGYQNKGTWVFEVIKKQTSTISKPVKEVPQPVQPVEKKTEPAQPVKEVPQPVQPVEKKTEPVKMTQKQKKASLYTSKRSTNKKKEG
tara:strand:+ start:2055 stop:2507 length:453 start_codon:yes stop_codon:yes gene_type:complete